MTYQLSPSQIEQIERKLPPQLACLKDQYPVSIANAAEAWEKLPYPEGYVPQLIEIYYEDEAEDSAIFIHNGELISLRIDESVVEPDVIMMEIDDQWAYIQIQGRVILNRIGGAVLPDIAVNPETLLKLVIANRS